MQIKNWKIKVQIKDGKECGKKQRGQPTNCPTNYANKGVKNILTQC